MKIVTKEYKVYAFNELSEESKEKVRQFYLDGQETFIFTDDCNQMLSELFPQSALKVEYSLGYCQGDGLTIYGNIFPSEILNHIKSSFTEKELKFFAHLFLAFGEGMFNIPHSRSPFYSEQDYLSDYLSDLEYCHYRNIPYELINKFERLANDYIRELCGKMEEAGYEFFYEAPNDEDLADWCEVNEYEFTADGKLFC